MDVTDIVLGGFRKNDLRLSLGGLQRPLTVGISLWGVVFNHFIIVVLLRRLRPRPLADSSMVASLKDDSIVKHSAVMLDFSAHTERQFGVIPGLRLWVFPA